MVRARHRVRISSRQPLSEPRRHVAASHWFTSPRGSVSLVCVATWQRLTGSHRL